MQRLEWTFPLFFFLGFSSLGAQTPKPFPTPRPPTFETGVEVVNLTATVSDKKKGYYLADLDLEDFAVLEDGVRQELLPQLFSREQLPLSLIIMIDSSVSMVVLDQAKNEFREEKLGVAKEAAIRLVRTLRPEDRASIMHFSDWRETVLDFTSDQKQLEEAVRSILTTAQIMKEVGTDSETRAALERLLPPGNTALYDALYLTLKGDVKAERKKTKERRRYAIVFLSDSDDTVSKVTADQVLEEASKSEVAVYAVKLRLSPLVARNTRTLSPRAQRPDAPSLEYYFLRRITEETGGRLYTVSALFELGKTYDRIAEELRMQYQIGYVSSNRRRDGGWRRIEVYSPTRKDLQMRHKQGYYAAKK